ncbi:hypothetical protein [Rheinheimera maricola]|uniref:Uncharacterized protein n=1 Tax=Rheinheimera maricola TaxID=2793282 RepID=A0ABS7XBM7_9GAMM|nr:hypothetical protein [Rheinheimera maricola]MBZ9612560.1 hypothetical protein [Rheinheimera maricola]
MKIKDVRRLLQDWGSYWAKMETPIGFCRVSITASLTESAKTGIWAAGERKGSTSSSDNIRPPAWVVQIDKAAERLPPAQRRALNIEYIKRRKLNTTEKLALHHAELEIMAVL